MNAFAQSWLEWIVAASCGSCLAAAAVAGFVWWARRRRDAHAMSWLLLIPLAALLLPLSPWRLPVVAWATEGEWVDRLAQTVGSDSGVEAPITAAEARADESRRERAAGALVDHGLSSESVAASTSEPVVARTPSTTSPLPWPTVLFLIWASVSATLIVHLLVRQWRANQVLRQATPLGRVPGLDVRELCRASGVRRPVQFRSSSAIDSPAAFGFFRSVVLLPESLLTSPAGVSLEDVEPSVALGSQTANVKPATPARGQLNSSPEPSNPALAWMILHELSHIRRHDIAIAALQQLLQIAFFFHPLVWICNRLVASARECACDDAALARTPRRDRLDCAAAFLEVLEGVSRRQLTPSIGLPLLQHRQELRRRMMNLIDPNHRPDAGLRPRSMALLFAGAMLALPAAATAIPSPVANATGGTDSSETTDRDQALSRALSWLGEQQREDGGWSVGGKSTWCGEFNQTGVTGLTILAHLQSPDAQQPTDTETVLERALQYLASHQTEKGRFGDVDDIVAQPSHAIATLAWLQAQDSFDDQDQWKSVARKAIEFIEYSRNPYRAWRYGVCDGDNDSFITSLMLWALIEAQSRGFEVTDRAFEFGFDFLNSLAEPKTGRTGYMKKGSPISRLQGKDEEFPPERSEMLTAMATYVRSLQPRWQLDEEVRERAIELMLSKPPRWDVERGTIDYYYWCFGALALAQTDSFASEAWNLLLERALLKQQQESGAAAGSFPPVDAWSFEGTDVHATAICAFMLSAAKQGSGKKPGRSSE